MDLIKDGMKNISLYEVKKHVRKAQNMVLNLSSIEAKVREATNNEPWGTPSHKMQEIADATYNYREREQIVGMIFRRFTEKSATEWRQIYKALILLEYVVKHGSEKVVDEARANMSLISMLKSFHYIDPQGRDKGLNIRNRSKLLLGLLNDDSNIRSERKKARENLKKFKGVAGGAPSYGNGIGNRRYGSGGFGEENGDDYDDDYNPSFGGGGAGGVVYGDGGMFGSRYDTADDMFGSDEFEEYNTEGSSKSVTPAPRKKDPQTTQDLFSFDDEPTTNNINTSSTQLAGIADDDFDDFQSASPSKTASPVVPQSSFNELFSNPAPGTNNQELGSLDLLGSLSTNTPAINNITPAINSNITTFKTTTTSYDFSSKQSVPAVNDAFSSLFSTAKSNVDNIKPRASSSSHNTITATDTIPSRPTHSSSNSQSHDFSDNMNASVDNTTKNPSSINDLDLLSL
ncbi:Ent4 protein [Saccharomycopsis crataegensis]|uniref:Ent4 protein n=1 Tax=Saccharomycopsis crataegensis TaxID=43959 RepID=A0AAV5QLJ1_9ASCO|nr:Ent4 protein [Saccharomycopsis crataegensis]